MQKKGQIDIKCKRGDSCKFMSKILAIWVQNLGDIDIECKIRNTANLRTKQGWLIILSAKEGVIDRVQNRGYCYLQIKTKLIFDIKSRIEDKLTLRGK